MSTPIRKMKKRN